jgi:hypothetical protein
MDHSPVFLRHFWEENCFAGQYWGDTAVALDLHVTEVAHLEHVVSDVAAVAGEITVAGWLLAESDASESVLVLPLGCPPTETALAFFVDILAPVDLLDEDGARLVWESFLPARVQGHFLVFVHTHLDRILLVAAGTDQDSEATSVAAGWGQGGPRTVTRSTLPVVSLGQAKSPRKVICSPALRFAVHDPITLKKNKNRK